jgi:hypothetical protein
VLAALLIKIEEKMGTLSLYLSLKEGKMERNGTHGKKERKKERKTKLGQFDMASTGSVVILQCSNNLNFPI